MIKLLIGGSPCTHWSIAQKNNRETEPEGLGWELFKNYLVAKENFKPDFFLYENNKSAAQPIKDQIAKELGVDLMYINSALVSAQNRQRFYAFNWHVDQPEDRGIVLRDILESGETWREKSLCLDACYYKGGNLTSFKKQSGMRLMAAELVDVGYDLTGNDKSYALTATHNGAVAWNTIERAQRNMVAEPIAPSRALNITEDGKSQTIKAQYSFTSIPNICCYGSTYGATGVATPTDAPVSEQFLGNGKDRDAMKRVYEVKDGFITIKGKQYPIKLADGCYIIRKLTPVECERLQTLPDGYTAAVSNSQRYRGLGNGWTAEVIIHILNSALKDVPRDEEIVVLSMYDGIGTGRYCLDKMGFTNVKYYAYEIDKYAKRVAMSNYPDIIQCGDAFDLRHPGWTIGY